MMTQQDTTGGTTGGRETFRPGDRVMVNISAGIIPGADGTPDWQPGTVQELLPSGLYRVHLDLPVAGQDADKEAAPEHMRRTQPG